MIYNPEIDRVRQNLAQAFRIEAERTVGHPLTTAALQMQLELDLRSSTARQRRGITRRFANGVILPEDIAALDQDRKDYHDLSYDPLTRLVTLADSSEVRLWPTEGLLFHPLIAYPERVLLNTTALDVFHYPEFSRVRTIIHRIRPKIKDGLIRGTKNDPEFKYLQTVPHTGYVLRVNPEA